MFGPTQYIWSTKAHSRVRAFLLLVGKDAILTWDNLNSRGWCGPSVCCLCRRNTESAMHIFILSKFVRAIWLSVDCRLLDVREHDTEVFWDHVLYMDKIVEAQRLTVAAGVLWNVLLERNNRIFNNLCTSVDSVFFVLTNIFCFGQVVPYRMIVL